MAPTLEAEEGIGRAIEQEASVAVTHQVTSGTVSPLSLSDLGYNADKDMLSEEPLASVNTVLDTHLILYLNME